MLVRDVRQVDESVTVDRFHFSVGNNITRLRLQDHRICYDFEAVLCDPVGHVPEKCLYAGSRTDLSVRAFTSWATVQKDARRWTRWKLKPFILM